MELGRRGGWLVAGALLVLVGCRSEPEWNPIREPAAELPTTAPGTTAPPAASTTLPSTVFPGEGVTDCANAIQFGAFSGDDELSAIWQSTGGRTGTVRSYCRDLSTSDPVAFTELAEGWEVVQALGTTTVAAGPADATLVAACVARIRWGNLGNDPDYVRVWTDLGSGSEFLDQACSILVLDDPELVREMAAEVEEIEAFLAATSPSTTLAE